ncbi:MAG TPA: ABC transporter ATP-binding protein [Planctomycetota bacterium]
MTALLTALDLAVELATPEGRVPLLDGVSFEVAAGETLALVGESGSGKTLTALTVLGLVPPPLRVSAGRAFFRERNLLRLPGRELRALRGRELAIVFQDPLGALHPLLTVARQLTEVLEVHERLARRAARLRAAAALEEVGLEPERVLAAYPHELSGGMRQRVAIAMALLLRPALLFADEPTTALDAHLEVQVLELLRTLQRRHGTAVVLISHDLARVAEFADRVQVLYAGRTQESAAARVLFERPLHPYTRGLLASTPTLRGEPRFPLPAIPGQPPDPLARPPGCAFHPRCPLASARCRAEVPPLESLRAPSDHRTACFETPRLLLERAR